MQRDRSADLDGRTEPLAEPPKGEFGLWRVSRRPKSASEDLQISSTLLSGTRVI